MGHLKERMSEDLIRYGLRPSTRKQYLHHAESYARHFKRSPEQLGSADIEAWLDHLERKENRPASFRLNALIALKFFYFVTLDRPQVAACFISPVKQAEIRDPLSKSDMKRLFSKVASKLHQTILIVAFGGGLRLDESAGLRTGDIDSQRMLIRLNQYVSAWPKFVPLHPETLDTLRRWWRATRPQGDLLFAARPDSAPLKSGPIQKALREAANHCGFDPAAIDKRLRYSFFIQRLSEADKPRDVMHILRCTSIRPSSGSFIVQQKASSFDACADGKGGRI